MKTNIALITIALILAACGGSKAYMPNYEEADNFYKQKKFKESLEKFQTAMAKHLTESQEIIDTQLKTALILASFGKFDEANFALNQLKLQATRAFPAGEEQKKILADIESTRKELKNYVKKAEKKSKVKDQEKMESLYKRGLKEFNSENWVGAYNLMKNIEDYKDVESYLEKLEEKIDAMTEKLFKEGFQLYAEDKYKEAIIKFNEVLKIDPGHKDSLDYKGKAEKKLKVLESL